MTDEYYSGSPGSAVTVTQAGAASWYVWTAPPRWPRPPAGWSPPEGWVPPPDWPAAPANWQWWQLAVSPWPAKLSGSDQLLWVGAGFGALWAPVLAGLLCASASGSSAGWSCFFLTAVLCVAALFGAAAARGTARIGPACGGLALGVGAMYAAVVYEFSTAPW